jgi:hypothetical protein
MNSFTDKARIEALNKAIKKVNRFKRTRIGYAYGISDCWTLFCYYDGYIRGNEALKTQFLGYKDQDDWFKKLYSTGFKDPHSLLSHYYWKDVYFEETQIGDMSAIFYPNNPEMWSTVVKVSPNTWYTSSNLPEMETLTDKFVKRHLHFSMRPYYETS